MGRFCEDFRPGIVPLFRSPVALAVFQAALAPVQKFRSPRQGLRRQIAFGCRDFWGLGGQKRRFEPGQQLLRIQSKGFELPAPFWRSIAKSLDSDAARRPAFDRGAHEVRCEERERYGHGYLTHAALLDVMRYRQISVLAWSPEAIGVGPFPHETPCRRRGSRTVNSVKSPTSLSTAIVPPCCWVTIS
jgi:hypothetical protein